MSDNSGSGNAFRRTPDPIFFTDAHYRALLFEQRRRNRIVPDTNHSFHVIIRDWIEERFAAIDADIAARQPETLRTAVYEVHSRQPTPANVRPLDPWTPRFRSLPFGARLGDRLDIGFEVEPPPPKPPASTPAEEDKCKGCGYPLSKHYKQRDSLQCCLCEAQDCHTYLSDFK